MKKVHIRWLGAAVVVLGVVAWFWFGRDRHREPAETQKPTEHTTSRDSAPVSARNTTPDELVFLSDVDRDGSLRLEGQVIDADDHPVANAEITVSTNPPRTIRSEADGSFAFARLVGRSYNLSARATAGFAGPVTARLTAKSEPVILKLRPAGSIEIETRDADGRPIANATIELRGVATNAATISATTGADGRVTVHSVGTGQYVVAAWATGYGKAYQEIRASTAMRNGEVVARMRLVLQRGATVAGRVLSPDGQPVQGAVVRFSSLAEFRARADAVRDSVATDASGRFKLEAMPRGTFRFQATHASFAPGTSKPVQLDGTSPRSDVEIRMEPGGELAGRVVSAAGSPVAFATVRVTARTKGAAYEAARQTYSDADGKFEITGLSRREMVLVALHETASSNIVSVDLASTPQQRDLVVTLDQVGTIAGTVVDEQGVPVAGAAVWPTFTTGTGDMRFQRQLRGFSQELTDSSGAFAIHGLVAGDYILYASRQRGASPGSVRLDSGTPAKVGDLRVKIVLPAEGGIEGIVQFVDGTSPPLFTVRVGSESKTSVPFATPDGRFRITGVAVGPTTVTVTGPTFDPATRSNIVITSGKPTDIGTILVEKGRTISGRVLDPDGQPVSDAKVYAGPRIFGTGAQAGTIDLNLPGAKDAVMIQTTSESDGFYSLHGIGIGDLALMAEHDARGRSPLQIVPGSKNSSTVDLVLLPFAAIEGTVTKAGQPLPDIAVTAASQSAATSTFVVSTGPDGSFRFDHVAPDTYKVSAVSGRSPKMGFGFAGQTVTATAGQTTSVRLEMNTGATLLVRVGANGTKPLNRAVVYVMAGVQTVANAKALTLLAAAVPGFSWVGAAVGGAPAHADSVPSGHYTVCAIAIPNEVDGMSKAFAYVDREGARMPAACTQFEMRDAPPEQDTSLKVDVPSYVPPPDGSHDPGGTGSGGGSGSAGTGSGGKNTPRPKPDA